MTASQKALAVPPGLAFCAVSDRLLERAKSVEGRGWYFDFLNLEKYLQRSTTPATPALSLMRALKVQLDIMAEEGFENRFDRHQRLAERTRQWALDNGFALMAEESYRSPTVTHVANSRDIDIPDLNRFLGERDMAISNGYGEFKGKSMRIAHMGEVNDADMERLFAAMEDYLGVAIK